MNILILFSHPWKFGGAENYVVQLTRKLSENGHKIILVTGTQKDGNPNMPWVTHYELNFRTGNPLAFVRNYTSLLEIVRKHNVDIIHAQQRTAGYFAAAVKRKTGVPFTITLHDIWHRAPLKALHGKIFTNIIAVSEFIRKHFIEDFKVSPDNIVTIYNGIDEKPFLVEDIDRLAQQIRKDLEIKQWEAVVTLVGRVTKAKGHFDLVTAIARLSHIPCKCLFVGDGPDLQSLRLAVQETSQENKFIFIGYRQDIPSILRASDIVVLPSYREAFPLTMVEAMLAKRPVIATKVGGIPEIVSHGDNGLLITPGDVEELGISIETLCNSTETRNKMGERGYLAALEKATLAKMVERTERVYRQLIEGSQEN